ncbi:MAG: pyridoxal phosphate-dependent aminotransferase, partial [Phycisphaerales bacterium]
TRDECRQLLDLCRRRNVLLISDEIYDEFCFDDAREAFPNGRKCPSPCREPGSHEDTLLIRGFGKTYGCTGWRMGYIAGPTRIVAEMAKLQQYSFVCAPTPLQWGCMATFEVDMSGPLNDYAARRDLVIEKLGPYTEVAKPGGAFYSFIKVPERLGMTGRQFFEKAVEKNVLIIPGDVFSDRDTHFRLSFATAKPRLMKGLDRLASIMAG